MMALFADYLKLDAKDELHLAAQFTLAQNLIQGDALTMQTVNGEPITFAEWGYLGKGKYQRRDFRYDVLTGSSAFSEQGSLFAHLEKHEIFQPVKVYSPTTVKLLAQDWLALNKEKAA